MSGRCTVFSGPFKTHITLNGSEAVLGRIEFEGKELTLHNLDSGQPMYRLMHAHDLDSGESVTIEFVGINSSKKISGSGSIIIEDSNSGPKCSGKFSYFESL
jgi:hypothetical protein